MILKYQMVIVYLQIQVFLQHLNLDFLTFNEVATKKPSVSPKISDKTYASWLFAPMTKILALLMNYHFLLFLRDDLSRLNTAG